jgi:drug/metabolite transporter (DMT)-like permease
VLRAWLLIGLGIAGVSMSGPIAAAVAVPALAVAFWRTALGALATAPVVFWRCRAELRALGARAGWAAGRAAGLAGLLLAVHFGTWIPSLRLTSVATSTALVTTAPLWIVAARRVRGTPVPGTVAAGALLGVAGVLVITGLDVRASPAALAGDGLALLGGAAGAGYAVVGEHARRTTSTPVYTVVAYAVCALALLPVCLLGGVPLAGWDGAAWGQLLLLTVVAQLLGHTAFNAAVPVVGAASLSLAILLEVPGATAVAWLWLGQAPPPGAVPGVLAILAGLALVARAGSSP